jgi:hypothetical protein
MAAISTTYAALNVTKGVFGTTFPGYMKQGFLVIICFFGHPFLQPFIYNVPLKGNPKIFVQA